MKKSVLFLVIFIAIALMSCDRAKYSDLIPIGEDNWFCKEKTLDGKKTVALVNRDGCEFIPFSEEYSKISTVMENHFFLAEKGNQKFLYDSKLSGILEKLPCLNFELFKYEDTQANFHPGTRYDIKTPDGIMVLYNFDKKYFLGPFEDYCSGRYGYFSQKDGKWGYTRICLSKKYMTSIDNPYELIYPQKVLLTESCDEIYELYDCRFGKENLLARMGKDWRVYDMEGNVINTYSKKINKNLPEKAKRLNGRIMSPDPNYLSFKGKDKVGRIIYDSSTPYVY